MRGLVLFVLIFLKICDAELWIWNSTKNDFVNFFTKQSLLKNVSRKRRLGTSSLISQNIQVVTHHMVPYLNVNTETGKLAGFLGDFWNILEEFLKFESNITQVTSFSEGIIQLLEDEADVYLAAIAYTNQTKSLTLSNPYFLNWYNFYFKRPEGKPANYLHFITFSKSLWTYLFVQFFLSTALLWISCFILRRIVPKLETIYSLPTFLLGVMASFFGAGYDLKLRCYSTRIQILIAHFFGMACCYALGASLVACLAVVDHPSPFTGLDDFPKQKTYSLCLRNITFVYDSLTDENGTLLPQWYNKVNTEQCPENMINLKAEHLCKNKVSVLESRIIMGRVLKKGVHCQVSQLPERYFLKGNHLAFSKKFKKEPITTMLLRIRSTGISDRIEQKFVLNELPNYPSTNTPNQITYSHVNSVVLIYLILIGISLVILAIEIIIDKYIFIKD